MKIDISPDQEERVLQALGNPKFTWRTIQGISKETGFGTDVILEVIARRKDNIVRSSILSESGEDLFATRKHFQEHASVSNKLMGALKNRAD